MKPQQLWRAIHVYPFVRGVEGFDDLLRAVRRLLPCGGCREHFDAYLATHPPDVSSRDALFAWGVELHNAVNARLGKPQPSLDEVRSNYFKPA